MLPHDPRRQPYGQGKDNVGSLPLPGMVGRVSSQGMQPHLTSENVLSNDVTNGNYFWVRIILGCEAATPLKQTKEPINGRSYNFPFGG
jgi:hypothetical protein